ncbi:uncharacterized protein Z519_09732 [Cladophialophora bantiana CBS 173.52]|uniref:Uncharacterized protein n=1 Tax=Cladophialophora bantiana (strain ATCC 10958 / CBS 173.52 / CDC B-1940 / NIH 8579) TaxID=1442370 RepID=A0A0D2EHQ0_CLAB1|nr:uncharacterized protein Z519_09732 [Cladophialophora bantiana CBS 173.52]KIW89576.1 hypothetical protein Z519_09732 [Cladophialophora bantiana CBS 173.52]
MAENAEEFRRLPSDELSEDAEMLDISESCGEDLPQDETRGRRTLRPGQTFLMAENHCEPIQSIEQDSEELRLPKFIIAIDFGTTFSSVAFSRLEPDTPTHLVGIESIECIDNFPDTVLLGPSADLLAYHQTVPTELMCYTQKDRAMFEDQTESRLSDNASCCSMDEDWASSSTNDSDLEEEQLTVPQAGEHKTRILSWGWGVYSRLMKPHLIHSEVAHLKNFKLLLDDSPATRDLRRKSARVMSMLKPAKVVDIIAEYLEQLLKHTKERLTAVHSICRGSPVEFVLSVPSSWTDTACRVMQDALTKAAKMAGLARLEQDVIRDLFIVAESEAAAAYALENRDYLSKMTTGESFLLLDCGGGTVDAVIYTLTQTNPIRLKEVIKPDGVCCGSSFLNENFKILLQQRLEHATFTGQDMPLESVISKLVQDFETEKRKINILDKKANFDSLYIYGLQADPEQRLRKNTLDVTWKEMYEVFKDCIRGVSDLMVKQLNAAKEKGVNVQTVIVIGGFGESPSLINHLKKVLRKERNFLGQPIDLERSRHVQSAVARGAVLRALRKEDGPERITRSSYGILRSERYNEDDPKHRKFRVTRSPADGELYIMDTIEWVVNKDTPVPTRYKTSFTSRHIFKVSEPQLLCEEVLYVSSSRHPSGYKVGHKMNKGKKYSQETGSILADLTFLKTEHLIQPKTEMNDQGKSYSYYEIVYDVWIIIEGRTLKFEARSPINKDRVTDSKQFCIAAGFVPGTA